MPNRLAAETSPYLLQHAGNPVDWHPWDEQALTLARQEDRPILLSIGYSACHWCHVMAHESFEDENLAALMNRLFICIKVDREERPDLDQIYQQAHQMLTGRPGGWPLTLFLTPDGTPFFGGTYFPRTARHGLPAFGELMQRIEEAFRKQRREITDQNRKLRAALTQTLPHAGEPGILGGEILESALEGLRQSFDAEFGGFGQAPKFPRPQELTLLLRQADDEGAREMALLTLRKMAEGGLFDQIGGGFCRYSVDAQWAIPHFEKMLYDNASLLRLYAEAYALTGAPLFRRVAEETATWVLREMQSPQGGYFSSLDADSGGEEGRFYLWTPEEALALLTPEEYAVVSLHYGLERPANFEGSHWHLTVVRPLSEVATALGNTPEQCGEWLDAARDKLFQARELRPRPGKDEKILTGWNALMIEGMVRAAAVFDRPDWLASARQALEFITTALWQEGHLLAVHKDGQSRLKAYLDDHAFLLSALLELLQADFRPRDLAFARQVAEALLTGFEDSGEGGFFFTSHDHETLIHRTKPGYDNATPAGNGMAAFALQRLGHVTGDARYLRAAERTLQVFRLQLQEDVGASATLLLALEEYLAPPRLLVLRARQAHGQDLLRWRRALGSQFNPDTLLLALLEGTDDLPDSLPRDLPGEGDPPVRAWLCSALGCLPPVDTLGALDEILKRRKLV